MTAAILLGVFAAFTVYALYVRWDVRRERKAGRRLLEVMTNGWAPEPANVDVGEALREDFQVAYLDSMFELPAYEERS